MEKKNISKGKKNVRCYNNAKNSGMFHNCITLKVKKGGKITENDEKIPGIPYKATGTKEEKLSKLPFSKEHDLLIAKAFGKENRVHKQQIFLAKHEQKISKIIADRKERNFKKIQKAKLKMPYVLTVERADSNGVPYVFSTNYSKKPLKLLKVIADGLAHDLNNRWKDFRSVCIYKKENLLPGLKGNPCEYTIHHYNLTKDAA